MWTVEDMLEVKFNQKDDFLKIAETLTRVGIASKHEKTLFQSCHILHKQSKYYIVSFKELFALDGRPTNLSENDIARRNTIAVLLQQWGLLDIVDKEKSKLVVPVSQIKIIPYKEKSEWNIITKYNIGKKKTVDNTSQEE